ncbi:hypothetical protein JCM3775_005760 [Rhodotorula graminis]|uniref:Beta-lactamase-related domain-containing protein n=1 Tax=Rhodotorula graminis (strain WP1) TaxID=578459 RepID=A0A194S4Y9_RHOGW|nr:uncharacterized protein RHOBADRAFT_43075 [Rhodotorula graminis WP1]KPV75652.1 hypothetical protein RHOBADRAFT_43075 [Rhodotorula graminis WP1]
MLSTASTIDAAIQEATADPYTDLPRAVVVAATSTDEVYRGHGGWAQLPQDPTKLEAEGERIKVDSVFELFSMTKLLGALAALQCVERGLFSLDDDASQYVPELKTAKVFVGFDEDGNPKLEDNSTPITIRMLATHTAGFGYHFWHPAVAQIAKKVGVSPMPYVHGATRNEIVCVPMVQQVDPHPDLLNKPGEHFEYGTSIDWLTLAVEAVTGTELESYLQQNILGPLGIADISYKPNPKQISMAYVGEDGKYQFAPSAPQTSVQHFGGSGLKGPITSYLRLLRALLRGGELDGARILKPETVDLMFEDNLNEQQRVDFQTFMVRDADPSTRKAGKSLPDMTYGIGGGLSGKGLASGRGSNALFWSGLANTHWIVDRERDVCFLVATNILPFSEERLYQLWDKVEKALYDGLPKASTETQ